jgi:NAD(P)H-hydrate epimerase
MIRVATAAEMQELDRRAAAECGIPSLLLMENAGAETVREMLAAFPTVSRSRVVVLCGRGNNGGDGFVVARRLLGGESLCAPSCWRAARRARDAGPIWTSWIRSAHPRSRSGTVTDLSALRDAIGSADLVVDALLGTGGQGRARGLAAEAIACVNESGQAVVSVDVPSGLGADCRPPGPAIRATLTVTFALPKRSLVLFPAAACSAGYAWWTSASPALWADTSPGVALLESADVAPAFPARGRRLQGVSDMCWSWPGRWARRARRLRPSWALRMGAGLVTVAVPASLHDILEVKLTGR